MDAYADYLPLSHLNAFEFCPRRFYYEWVQGEMLVNEHVLEGRLRHAHADTPGSERIEAGVRLRRLTLWSDRLRVIGLGDLVEVQAGVWQPVEYKKGKWGRWLNDHIQLCAQALCLEERLGEAVPVGHIFYFGSARRERVEFTPALRAHTEAAIAAAREVARAPHPPPPITQYQKCRACSLEPLCLPREVQQLHAAPGQGV